MRILCATVLIVCALVISGCMGKPAMTATSTQPDQVQGAAIRGRVHGGQNPVSGASVYLFAAGTGGYGGDGIAASSSNASTSLLNSSVLTQTPAGGKDSSNNYYATTDPSGNFSISNDYTCPSASTQVYLYAVGGNSGSGTNSAAGLLAGLGPCGSLSSTTYVIVNEVSTIATAYALAGFATDATHISSSNTSLAATNVTNAFATVANLEARGTGTALATAPASGGLVPQARINTLANILAACINSTGPSSTGCTTLLGGALSGGTTGTAPTDTATAAINIAHNPVTNLSTLLGLQTANSPFMPDLSAVPNDFTISIVLSGAAGSNFNFPEYVAVDASGNVWVTNGTGPGYGFGEVSKFSNTGAGLVTVRYLVAGMALPMGIAIDASGNAWTADLAGTITELDSNGDIVSPVFGTVGYAAGGLTSGYGIAIDASGNVWAGCNNGPATANIPYVPGSGACIVELNSSGVVQSGANGFTGGGLDGPIGILVDTVGHVWTANNANSSISEFNSSGTPISPSNGFNGGGVLVPWDIAMSGGTGDTPYIWTSNLGNSSWSLFGHSGTADSPSTGYTGEGVTDPFSIALDTWGNFWVTSANGMLGESNSTGSISGPKGFGDGYTDALIGMAIDGSGNVWVTRPGGIGGTSTGSLTEYVGAAGPVVTPIVANLKAPYGSQPVNKP